MISFILSRCSNAWNDFFTSTPTKYEKQTYTSNQTFSRTSVYVLSCLFNRCTSTSDGGALYCTSVIYLLVELSSFFSCSTSGKYGGAIYFYNTSSGECVLHKVCGNGCCATTSSSSYGQFTYVRVNISASSKHCVNYSSIVRCVNENSSSQYTLYHDYGKICCPSVNISMNKCGYRSGILCYPFQDSSFVTCSLSYSSFADNNATVYICIYFQRTYAKYEMKCCNIIRNTQISDLYGTIHSNGNLTIEDSCILENKANYIFYAIYSNTITLSNCTVDSLNNTNGLIMHNIITKSFILSLDHISTKNCHAEYDSVLTKKENCYTCKNNHYHARISYFFSINWVFTIALIHPNPSEDCWYDCD